MMATLYYEHKVAVELQQWRLSALTSQHRVLVLGCADQPADTINHLALRVQLFFLRLLAEKNHWEGRKKQSHIQKSEKKHFNNEKSTKFGFTGHGGCWENYLHRACWEKPHKLPQTMSPESASESAEHYNIWTSVACFTSLLETTNLI